MSRLDRHSLAPGILVATTRRTGGVSTGSFASLNLSFHPADDPERVRENRRRVARDLDLDPERFTCGRQVHGASIHRITREDGGRGALRREDALPGTDGMVTDVAGLPLMAFGADCPVVVLFDPARPAIGIAHSGWRGTAAGIVPRLVEALTVEFGSDPQRLRACLAPSIGGCCYEVGQEVVDALSEAGEAPERHGARRSGSSFLDLRGIVREQLTRRGLLPDRILEVEHCTRCRSDVYFSYREECARTAAAGGRREDAVSGTFATIALLEPAG